MKRSAFRLLVCALVILSTVSIARASSPSPRDLWSTFPQVKKTLVLNDKVQYLMGYNESTGDVLYGDLGLVEGYLNGSAQMDTPPLMKTITDYNYVPGPMQRLLDEHQIEVVPGDGGGCTAGSKSQSLTKGKMELVSYYYYALTVWVSWDCSSVTSIQAAAAHDALCYSASSSSSTSGPGTSAWAMGTYTFNWDCEIGGGSKSRWIRADAYKEGTISWTYAAP